jgi:hypothetical protein
MGHLEWSYLQFGPETKARARRYSARNHFRQTAAEVRRLEDVFEDAFDVYPGAFIRANAECAKAKVQRPDVIQTKNVIGVAVGNKNEIESLQSEA